MRNEKLILKGIGVSAGNAEGMVKIITNNSDLNKFNEGDILVTKITDPSMVSLMAKAAAIITDIGGMTSHPAIVSREMGTPCVVATKNATSILKDGVNVKVDGNKGEIYLKDTKNEATNDDYDNMLASYRKAFLTMDFNTFDVSTDFSKLDPLITNSWPEKLLEIINKTKLKKLPYKEISRLMHSPSVIRNINFFDLFIVSVAKLPTKQKKEIGNFYINILKAMCVKDPFALDFNNLVHGQKKLERIYAKAKPGTPLTAKKLGRLINACYHLSYSLYGDMNPQILYENYGPYYIKDSASQNYLAVIREFKNMRPVEIWRDINKMPFSKIRIVSFYKNVQFTIDSITHTNYQGDIINGLRYFTLEVDDQPVEIQRVENITDIVENFARLIWSSFKKLDDNQLRILYLYQKAYNYKLLCERLGMEWRPSREMMNEITSKPLKQWPKFDNQKDENEFFLKIIDPRTDFSG